MHRISVIGCPGSGKSTISRQLADLLDVPLLELDSIFHQAEWTELPGDEVTRQTTEVIDGDGWVVDGNYSAIRTEVVSQEELWNGNRERASNLTSGDPHRSILRWAWTRFRPYRDRYETTMNSPRWDHLCFVRLRSSRQVARFMAGLAATATG